MTKREVVGYIHVDSAMIFLLDPGRLLDWQYNSIIDTPVTGAATEVWLDEEPDADEVLGYKPRRTNDGVVVPTGSDDSFPVEIEYGTDGQPDAIRIQLR
jgi:hypothetical protein